MIFEQICVIIILCYKRTYKKGGLLSTILLRKKEMKNVATNQSNKRFSKVQEELKRLLSIVMYSINEDVEEQGLDYFIDHGTSEDKKIAQYLKQDSLSRDENIKNGTYLTGTTPKRKQTKNISSSRGTTITSIPHTQNNERNISLSRNIEDREL